MRGHTEYLGGHLALLQLQTIWIQVLLDIPVVGCQVQIYAFFHVTNYVYSIIYTNPQFFLMNSTPGVHKACLHVTSASNVKNGLCLLTFQLSRIGQQRLKENANATRKPAFTQPL